jgi:PAB-dependent poly(A)-specific ribonuclease subunit 3
MGFINERPEYENSPQWRESGDRVLLKLFRDYVFHQVSDAGEPVVDLAHVLACLNKLDAGTDERIMLVSRDELACFIVTYKEVFPFMRRLMEVEEQTRVDIFGTYEGTMRYETG